MILNFDITDSVFEQNVEIIVSYDSSRTIG